MDSIQLNVNLSFQQLIDVVKKLTPAERLKLNDALWDETMEVPAEHKILVAERMAKSKQNPERMLDWDTAANSLKP